MSPAEKTSVLAVGQTPPPYGGQAIMLEYMMRGHYESLHVHPVRMAFSPDMDSVGGFRFGKLWHLVTLIVRIIVARFRYKTSVLYYPPAGPDRIPFYRDIALLISTRWLFRTTVFHFHAGGLSELVQRLWPPERLLFRLAYQHPDGAIRTTDISPRDDIAVGARSCSVVRNGIPDEADGRRWMEPESNDTDGAQCENGGPPCILFVGVLRESKGIGDVIRACALLQERGVDFRLDVLGRFQSSKYEAGLRELTAGELEKRIRFRGVLTGDEKWRVFARAQLFCFPTYFESENQPLVILEAMQFALPVVATDWRGISTMIEPGVTGELVPIRDPVKLAEALEVLLKSPGLRREMGERGRQRYLELFTLDRFYGDLERAIVAAVRAREDNS